MKKNALFLVLLFLVHLTNAQWTQQVSNVSSSLQIAGINFIHPDTGFIVGGGIGGGGFIRKTIDGGTTWTTSPHPLASTVNLSDVKMIDKNLAYIVGFDYNTCNTTGGRILKTVDGGSSWTVQSSFTYPGLLALHFINKDTGFAVGYNGIILKTINGGLAWSQISSNVTNNLRDISFPSTDTGYIVADYDKLLKTTDMGDTWSVISSGTSNILLACYFTSNDIGFTCGANLILKTMDGGDSWSTFTTNYFTHAIHFPDSDTGYIVGSYGLVFKTSDGGNSWQSEQISDFGSYGLYAVYFLNPSIGYTGGYDGKLFKTTNGGGFVTGSEFNEEPENVSVFPNPSDGIFQIAFDNSGITSLEIFNVLGEKVYSTTNFIHGIPCEINLSNSPKGIYFVKIYEGKIFYSEKIMIH
jgi:photosystem II stability/assembly factor-like uncharacterized protein